MRREDFRKMFREFLNEVEGPKKPGKSASENNDSLDVQVDRLLTTYENEAKNLKQEGRDFRSLVKRLIIEADEDKEKDDKDKEDATQSAPKLGIEDLDVESFSTSVVRLIDNYENLLEIRNTLIRRARSFLEKGYSPDVVKQFMTILDEDFDIKLDMSDVDKKFAITAPAADRAGQNPGS